MFDIGFWEILLILVMALIVLGPERLPQAARSVGYWVGKARRYVEGVKDQVESEFDTTELKRLLHNQDVQIKELQNKVIGGDLQDKVDAIERSVNETYTDTLDSTDSTDSSDSSEAHHQEPRYEMLEEDDGGVATPAASPATDSSANAEKKTE
jgi:sec-independent protein translocase protein TatB